jgi:Rhs element Vgr protein
MASEPDLLAVTIPAHEIKVDGSDLDETVQILSIDIWLGVDRLPRARLVVSDGDAAEETFAVSESASLIPGVAIQISLGYGSSLTKLFDGVIQRHAIELTENGASQLVVEATDQKAMGMTLARGNAVFESQTDSAICEKLISSAGLTAAVTKTSTTHERLVQHYATDWDLLVTRAQANGMVVIVDSGKATVAPPDTSKSPVLELTYGESLLEFSAEIDAASQIGASAIKGYSWDPATQKLAASTGASAKVSTPGNLSSSTLASVFAVDTFLQQSGGEMIAGELTDWASAELLRSQLSKVRGRARFEGSALVKPNTMVSLKGLGARFNGDAWVSGVHHRLAAGLWMTVVDIGLAPGWFAASAPQIAAPGASGQLPPLNTLQIGKVKQIHSDPEGNFRVLVTVPLLQDSADVGIWARFGSFYASTGIGSNFYPEVDDEVVLAFLNGDPRYPVILGSLYSKANAPPYPPVSGSPPNNVKSIMTKSKLHIDFIEDQPQILIETPGKQSISINDKTKTIKISDMNGNTVTLDQSGIALDSPKDIKLTATGSIKLTATQNIELTATMNLDAKAGPAANLKADGPVQIKGAIIGLNS